MSGCSTTHFSMFSPATCRSSLTRPAPCTPTLKNIFHSAFPAFFPVTTRHVAVENIFPALHWLSCPTTASRRILVQRFGDVLQFKFIPESLSSIATLLGFSPLARTSTLRFWRLALFLVLLEASHRTSLVTRRRLADFAPTVNDARYTFITVYNVDIRAYSFIAAISRNFIIDATVCSPPFLNMM